MLSDYDSLKYQVLPTDAFNDGDDDDNSILYFLASSTAYWTHDDTFINLFTQQKPIYHNTPQKHTRKHHN